MAIFCASFPKVQIAIFFKFRKLFLLAPLAAVLNFLVIAFCIYVLVQAFEKAKKRLIRQEALAEEAPDATVLSQERLTGAIE